MPAPAPLPAMGPFAAPFQPPDAFDRAAGRPLGMPSLTVPEIPWSTVVPNPGTQAPVNEVAQAQERKGWASEKAAVAQSSLEEGCGEASLAFIQKASSQDASFLSEKQQREEVRATAAAVNAAPSTAGEVKVNLDDGATAQEMGAVLGNMGIDVARGMESYDAKAMTESLKAGQFVMAMVDSNALLNSALAPGERLKEPGALHWVTIDGFNSGGTADTSDDKYRVKDPVHGEYWVSAKDLKRAVDEGKQRHGGGGLLALEKRRDADTREELESLTKKNLDRTRSFGKAGGHGSRRFSVGESS
jgi:hypothetical protein